ncbi:hypothetical protein AADR41_26885 [Streptomyces sp. CLV115]
MRHAARSTLRDRRSTRIGTYALTLAWWNGSYAVLTAASTVDASTKG